MSSKRDQIADQLEFLRDIGVDSLDIQVRGNSGDATRIPAVQVPAPVPEISTEVMKPSSNPDLQSIRDEIGDCQRCKLAPTRTNIVFGSGNPRAELLFVGEAPGADEDEQGLPFVGRAGQLLTKIIESIEIKREDVYICNVLKCRPPNNRPPEPDEVSACNPFLRKQLAMIKPKVVCCLGTFAAHTVLQSTVPISKLRGKFYDIDGIRIIATFHPSYLLRSPDKKREVWDDMKQIRAELQRLRT